MDAVVHGINFEYDDAEALFMICGLILGRPRNLRHDDTYYYFVKGIISGDLDCDKIDYVARDAYYAGIPTATDIDRLMSQLVAVEVRENTQAEDLQYDFGAGNPNTLKLLGIRPAGASALEMFVMTRSYLFERLYAHPKVRAVERLLKKVLVQRIQFGREKENWGIGQIFDLLYSPAGDYYLLGSLVADKDVADAGDYFSLQAQKLLERDLPVRALAISAATMAHEPPRNGTAHTSEFMPWQAAEDELSQEHGIVAIEKRICSLVDINESTQVIVDWYLKNPVSENPDIWVSDPADDNTVKRVNSYFNVEQLSNAYRSTKQDAWVFTSSDKVVEVSGAAALALQEAYDLVPQREAFNRAKIAARHLTPFFDSLRERKDEDLNFMISNIEAQSADQMIIKPPPRVLARALLPLEASDRTHASERLARQIGAASFPRLFYDHLYIANQVLSVILTHAKAFYRHKIFDEPVAHKNEARFQGHLIDYCNTNEKCLRLFDVREGEVASGGNTDVVFSWKSNERVYPEVVVELKSEQNGFEAQYNAHAGQPFQYTENKYGRVSILYAQFKTDDSIRLADTLQARINRHQESPQLVICVGQHAFAKVPSAGGSTAKAISS